jgi:hypothetical protein
MAKKGNSTAIILLLGAAAVGGYFYFKNKGTANPAPTGTTPAGTTPAILTTNGGVPNYVPPVKPPVKGSPILIKDVFEELSVK